jgi:general secretion pathway protein I
VAERLAKHGFTPVKRSAEHGFTLIEIMVALAVFSLAVLALIRLESGTIRGVSIIDATAGANLVARNVAVEAVTDAQPPTLGTASGREANGGRTWAWTRTVTPTGNTQVLRVDVSVADPRGTVLARATLVRPPPPSLQP